MAQSEVAQTTVGKVAYGAVDLFGRLREEHTLQRGVCDVLERIADSLPEDIDPALARAAASVLEHAYRDHMHFEEQHFYPLLRRRAARDARLIGVLDKLVAEHGRDEGFALEIVDELTHLARAGAASNPNMLGYMLRGFFEGQRRQIDWEDALVLPMAEAVLDEPDIFALRAVLDARVPDIEGAASTLDQVACARHK